MTNKPKTNKPIMTREVIVIDDNKNNLRIIEKIVGDIRIEFDEFLLTTKVYPITAERNLNDGELNEEKIFDELAGIYPFLAIVDMRLKGDEPEDYSGIDLLLKIKARYANCRIILISAYFKQGFPFKEKEYLKVFDDILDRTHPEYLQDLREKCEKALRNYPSGLVEFRGQRFVQNVNLGSKTMWGMVIGPEPKQRGIRISRDLPIPFLYADSVMVEVIEVGICGTDKHSLGKENPPEYEVIDFHEAFGKVVWIGEWVKNLKVGDFVVPMVRRCEPWNKPERGDEISPSSFTFFNCDCQKQGNCYPLADECPRGEYEEKKGRDNKKVGYKSRGTGKCHGFGSQYFIDTEDWLIKIDPNRLENSKLRELMMQRYVLTEPLSIAWKMRRQILKYRKIREFEDRVLFIGLGPIGLLSATIMSYLHPGLQYTAIDLADENKKRVKMLEDINKSIKYFQAIKENEAPEALKKKKFNIIIEATGQPEKIFEYAPNLLAPGGVLVLLGVSEEDSQAQIGGNIFTHLVKRNNIFIGSVNSSRVDFEDSVAFMERIIGDKVSILERMVTYWAIDDNTPQKIIKILGNTLPEERDEIKVVLRAKEFTEKLRNNLKKPSL